MQTQLKALNSLFMVGLLVGCGGSGSPQKSAGAGAPSAAIVAQNSDNMAVESALSGPAQTAENTRAGNNVASLTLSAAAARTPVAQNAMVAAPTGNTVAQCFQAGSDNLVACDSPQAIALSGAKKQDGMRAQSGTPRYAPVGNHPLSSCVQDKLTGLIWEGKEATGPRAEIANFTNFDSTQKAQKWGVFDHADPTQPTLADLNAATNTLGYVQYVNQIALCGASDWRLPTLEELESLVDTGRIHPAIDTQWFVNSGARWYWSASPNQLYPHYAWLVNFTTGTASHSGLRGGMEDPISAGVRLVRTASKARVGE